MHTMSRLVRRNSHNLIHQVSHQLQEWILENDHHESALVDGDTFKRPDVSRQASSGAQTPRRVSFVDAPDGGESPLLREARAGFSRSLPGSMTDLRRLADESAELVEPRAQSLPGSMTDLKGAGAEAEKRAERPSPRPRRTRESPSGAVFSNRGDQLLSVGESGTLRLWDLTDPTQYTELRGMPETAVPVRCSFSPDDSMVLATPSLTDVLFVWDLHGGTEAPVVLQAPSRVLGECFSRDGARIAVTCADTVAVWSCGDLGDDPILLPRGH